MPSYFHEDTLIETRPKRSNSLFAESFNDPNESRPRDMFERCRTMFRELGERLSSFDLGRQIYG